MESSGQLPQVNPNYFLGGNCGLQEISVLGGAFLIFIKNIFFRFFEVFICSSHSVFSQGHQTSFCTDCLDVATKEVGHLQPCSGRPLLCYRPVSSCLCESNSGNWIFPGTRWLFLILLLWERIFVILNQTKLMDKDNVLLRTAYLFNFLLQNLVII